MLFRVLDKPRLRDLVDLILSTNEVIGPKRVGQDKDGKPVHQFLPVVNFDELDLAYETSAYSAKTYFLPFKENLSTYRYDDGGWGTILSADANIRLGSAYSWATQYVYSLTEEPVGVNVDGSEPGDPEETFAGGRHTVDLDGESYSGAALITELRRNSRAWNFTLDYNTVSPTYRTQTGYDPWNDQHNDTIHPQYRDYAQDGMFPLYHLYFGSKWEIDPLLTYRLDSFSMFYLGSTHDYRDFNASDPDQSSRYELTDRVYFMKVQYLFQI